MRSTRRADARAALLALATTAGALGACRDPYPAPPYVGAGSTGPHVGGTFRYAFDSELRSLDPHVGYDEVSNAAIRLVFDTLVDYAPDTHELAPSLAERYTVSPDGRTYTFTLRDGVRFHHGRTLVARDVRDSFERMLDPRAVPCPGTSFFHLLEGFEDFQAHRDAHLRGIETPDARTVVFHLRAADRTFLDVLAMPFAAPIPIEVARAVGRDAFAQQPVGTGPFRVARWENGARVELARHENYWRRGQPYLDRVVIETGLARHLQFMRFQRGDLEYVHSTSLSTADYLWIRSNPAWRQQLVEAPDSSVWGLAMNTEIPPWNNRHLRRAVSFALDRESIVRSKHGRIAAARGLYPPGIPGYDPALPGAHRYDLDEARREMALAGFRDGVPGEHDLWVVEGDVGAAYGQLLQADLARIGVQVRLRQASFPVFLATTQRRGAAALSLSAWSQDYPDPSNFIETLFHSRNATNEDAQNVAFYANPRLDALLDRARVEADRARRFAMYREAEQLVVDDAPWAFLYTRVVSEVTQPYVRGYAINPVFAHDVRTTWLDLPRRRAGASTSLAARVTALATHSLASLLPHAREAAVPR